MIQKNPWRGSASNGDFAPWAFATGQPLHDLHHVVVFGERHLRHILLSYMHYYNGARTHLSLNKDAPVPRAVQAVGRILPTPILGGLHHQYAVSYTHLRAHETRHDL